MADVRVTYDETANAAYVHLTDPQIRTKSSRMYPCDPVGVDGMINLDFDEQGRLIGIEVLAASSKLPQYLLKSSERPDAGGDDLAEQGVARAASRAEQRGSQGSVA
ncbi:DUF2283 domain-containing protein [Kitasatospora sp. NPDC047058]|uniref:DUF2283 domain-containing protein n=1 Tax=Kitasatospora sp. NPDC047058 TaxID=3155620 RepID=UPI0033E0E959